MASQDQRHHMSHPTQNPPIPPQQQGISGNNNDLTQQPQQHSMIPFHIQLQMMNQTITNIQTQHNHDIQALHQSMTVQIQSLTNKMHQNQQKNQKTIHKLQQKIAALSKQSQKNKQNKNEKPKPPKKSHKKAIVNSVSSNTDEKDFIIDEVKEWLTDKCKCPQYYLKFMQNGYATMTIIYTITDTHLQKMGIPKSDRKVICKQVKLLNHTNNTNANDTKSESPKTNQKNEKTKKSPTPKFGGKPRKKWEKVKAKPVNSGNMFETHPKPAAQTIKIKKTNKNQKITNKSPNKLFDLLPMQVQNGCRECGINGFNPLQYQTMNSLYASNTDNLVVSPAMSGKTVSIILSSIYRLSQANAPVYIVLIAVDVIHCQMIANVCNTVLQYSNEGLHISVIEQVKGQRYCEKQLKGQNKCIFICSPAKAVQVFKDNTAKMIKNSICVSIFDGDSLLNEPLFTNKIQNMFQYVPDSADMDINIVSNSLCPQMAMNVQMLLGNERYARLCTFECNTYENLCFWAVKCNKNKKVQKLLEILKANVHSQGLIFVAGPHSGKKLMSHIYDKYKCVLFEGKTMAEIESIISEFNQKSIQYLVIHTYSPLYALSQCNAKCIIHFDIKQSCDFLKRCAVGQSSQSKHCISLIDEPHKQLYEDIERECNIRMTNRKISRIFSEDFVDNTEVNLVLSDEKVQSESINNNVLPSNDALFEQNHVRYNNDSAYYNQGYEEQRYYNQNQQLFYGNNNQNYVVKNNNFSGVGEQEIMADLCGEGEGDMSGQKMVFDSADIVIKPKSAKQELIECINRYMISGNINEILNLNCGDFKVWASVINESFRDRKESEIPYLIGLIIHLFRHKVFDNNDSRFNDVIIKYLVIELDVSAKVNAKFVDYIGFLLANLCCNKCLISHQCYSFFMKRYKEYSDENKKRQKINLNRVITASILELKRINAPQKLTNAISKFRQ